MSHNCPLFGVLAAVALGTLANALLFPGGARRAVGPASVE
jgi:hypothetical protein